MNDRIKGAAKPTSDNSHPEVIVPLGWIRPTSPATLLDVGFGGGQFLLMAAKMGLDVYGIDADWRMVRHALDLMGSLYRHRIIQGMIGGSVPAVWPTPDYVSCFEVVEHSQSPAKALAWLRERLKPGGWLVGSVPDNGKAVLCDGELLKEVPDTPGELIQLNRHKTAFDVRLIQMLLETAGFESVEVKRVQKEREGGGGKKRLLFRGRRPAL